MLKDTLGQVFCYCTPPNTEHFSRYFRMRMHSVPKDVESSKARRNGTATLGDNSALSYKAKHLVLPHNAGIVFPKYTTLMQDTANRENWAGRGMYIGTLCYLLDFSINLKLF